MKRFLPILLVMILVVSMIGILDVSAGASISGYSSVLAGRSYTYKGTAKFTATSLICAIKGLDVWQDGDGGGSDTDKALTATASIKVSIPSSAKPGDTYTIEFWGKYQSGGEQKSFSTKKTITVVEKQTPDPNATPRPPEGWDIVKEAVREAEEGAVVEAVMEDDYKIPESLLKMIIENKNILHVNFGTYTCTIDPAKFTDIDGIKKLNLKLDFEKAAGLSEIAGNKDVYQLHFGHVGELPGMLKFTFKATENKPGDVVYLYYYYGEANVIEGKTKAVVDENGMLTFEIYHCSSYFVTSEVLEGASSNFDTETQAKLDEINITLGEKQTELDEANAKIASLEEENTVLGEDLTAAKAEAAEFEDMAEKALAEPETEDTEFSLVVLIAAVAAAIMLSILLTMLITRSGLFKRSGKATAEKNPEYQTEAVPEPKFESLDEPVQETGEDIEPEERTEQAGETEPENNNKIEF